jgi:protein-disulfide isomerase
MRGARRRLLLFDDPQCPHCRRFEEASGDMLRGRTAGTVQALVVCGYRIS